jgi:hypothetical protein
MVITEPLHAEFIRFISSVPVRRLKQNTAKVLSSYLDHNSQTGLPDFMDDFLTDLMAFFDLLDTIEQQIDQSNFDLQQMAAQAPEKDPNRYRQL